MFGSWYEDRPGWRNVLGIPVHVPVEGQMTNQEAKYVAAYRARMKAQGIVPLQLMAHKDDHDKIREFADRLAERRQSKALGKGRRGSK